MLTIRTEDNTRQIPVIFLVVATPTNWLTLYEAASGGPGGGPVTLTVVHSDAQPNQYYLAPSAPVAATNLFSGARLSAAQTMAPFAGSDFWIADLGLEFLHWPQQRLLRKEMHRSRSCNVLESVIPNPVPGGYARVVSWIDIETGGILTAEAYDARDRLLKQFATKKIEKVHGQWQLEGMEIRNRQTGSRTRIEFDLR
jgi:hypothetical protein